MNSQAPPSSTSPEEKPIIAVCGATGFQGGSVANHLLRDGRFAVRAITRKPKCPQAQELARAGATVVQADFDDLSSLCKAFEGCYGAFGMTDYYEAFEREAEQGINIVKAAKSAKLKHLVQSVSVATKNPEVKVCKYKAQVHDYLKKSGVPYTGYMPTFYFGSIFLLEILAKCQDGDWEMKFPFPTDIPIPTSCPKDIGGYVLPAFTNPSEWVGRDMRVCNERMSLRRYAEIFAEVTGFNVKIHGITREEFLALENDTSYPLGAWAAFKLWLDEYDRGRDFASPELAAQIYPGRQTWRDFIIEYREVTIPQPVAVAVEYHHIREQFEHA